MWDSYGGKGMGFLVVVCGDFLVKVTENGGRRRRQVWLGLKEKGAGTSPGNSRESGALVLSDRKSVV